MISSIKEGGGCLPWHRATVHVQHISNSAFSDLKLVEQLKLWTTQPTDTVALAKQTKASRRLSGFSMSVHKEPMKDLDCGKKKCVRARFIQWHVAQQPLLISKHDFFGGEVIFICSEDAARDAGSVPKTQVNAKMCWHFPASEPHAGPLWHPSTSLTLAISHSSYPPNKHKRMNRGSRRKGQHGRDFTTLF